MRTAALGAALVAAACGASARSTGPANTGGGGGEPEVVLVAVGGNLALLACWDGGRLTDEPGCTAAIADAPRLRTAGDATVTAGAKADVVYCEIGDESPMTVPGFGFGDGEAPAIAVYPATAKVALAMHDGQQEYPATDAQRAAAVRALLAAVPGLVDTRARGAGTVDLDGDGALDTLVIAGGTTPSDDLGTAHEALYADFGDGTMVELFKETGTPAGGLTVNATLDLGGDGRTELYVSGWWNGGNRDQIVAVGRDRTVTAVGKLGCDS